MLTYLMQSFLDEHLPRVGLDMEERSVDEMRHLGWIGKHLGQLGVSADFARGPAATAAAGEQGEARMYEDVRRWASAELPALLPTLDRILAHERYHQATLSP